MTTEQIDRLYPAPPAPTAGGACPEAALSLCLKGRLRGVDAQLTIRGSTREEFLTNVLAVMDLTKHLDALTVLFDDRPGSPPAATATPPEGWCAVHDVQMEPQSNARGNWYSHKLDDGTWCKGKKGQGPHALLQ